MTATKTVRCPECRSTSHIGYGYAVVARRKVQRFRCRKCQRVFQATRSRKDR